MITGVDDIIEKNEIGPDFNGQKLNGWRKLKCSGKKHDKIMFSKGLRPRNNSATNIGEKTVASLRYFPKCGKRKPSYLVLKNL